MNFGLASWGKWDLDHSRFNQMSQPHLADNLNILLPFGIRKYLNSLDGLPNI
jgi:hypothetical protein